MEEQFEFTVVAELFGVTAITAHESLTGLPLYP